VTVKSIFALDYYHTRFFPLRIRPLLYLGFTFAYNVFID